MVHRLGSVVENGSMMGFKLRNCVLLVRRRRAVDDGVLSSVPVEAATLSTTRRFSSATRHGLLNHNISGRSAVRYLERSTSADEELKLEFVPPSHALKL